MGYLVGISSGWWSIGKDPILLGLAQKIGGFGAVSGSTFNQVDLESPAEFFEPRLKQNVLRVQRELGVKTGMHAEIGMLSALESAERRIWEEAHKRLVESVKWAAELNMIYVNVHLSSTTILQFEEQRIRPFGFQYQIVTPEGEPFYAMADKSKAVKEFVFEHIEVSRALVAEKPWMEGHKKETDRIIKEVRKEVEEAVRNDPRFKDATPEQIKEIVDHEMRTPARAQEIRNRITEATQENNEFVYQCWKNSPFSKYVMQAGEIDAYIATAYYMKETGDPLWSSIAKGKNPEDMYVSNDFYEQLAFNAAIASRYIEGHLKVKNHAWNKQYLDGMSILEWLKKTGLILALEIPEVGGGGGEGGHEGLYRLFDPRHSYHFIKKISSPQVRLCIDFEHMLSQKLDPYKILEEMPGDFGAMISLFHLGEPKPYRGTAHIPIPLGSQAQEVLYEWLYTLRKKGFKNGIMIFERGGGRTGRGSLPGEVIENSVIVLKKFAEFLEKDVAPKDLPLEFYGISYESKDFWPRQMVAMRDHAFDPLEGLLSVPEEKHTFLSGEALRKGKREEWEKRRYR